MRKWIAAALAVLAALAAWGLWPDAPDGPRVVAVDERIGGPYTLVDHHGRTVTDRDFRGKVVLMTFGYTSCADICPTTLQHLGEAMTALGPDAARVQPLFVSIDPERDTPAALKLYAAAFHPAILALTGSPEQLRRMAQAFRITYRRQEITGGYSFDHSAIIYVIDAEGRYRSYIPHDAPAQAIRDLVVGQLARPADPAG